MFTLAYKNLAETQNLLNTIYDAQLNRRELH